MFLPPYCSRIHRGRGTTFHVLRHLTATSVKFHRCGSNMSSTPSLHVGITISVQLCSKNNRQSQRMLLFQDELLPFYVVVPGNTTTAVMYATDRRGDKLRSVTRPVYWASIIHHGQFTFWPSPDLNFQSLVQPILPTLRQQDFD